MQGLEKYLMTKIMRYTFSVSELDRERDEALSMRMSALSFIEPKHLDIPELYQDEKSWLLARKELHKINNYKVRSLPCRFIWPLLFLSCRKSLGILHLHAGTRAGLKICPHAGSPG